MDLLDVEDHIADLAVIKNLLGSAEATEKESSWWCDSLPPLQGAHRLLYGVCAKHLSMPPDLPTGCQDAVLSTDGYLDGIYL